MEDLIDKGNLQVAKTSQDFNRAMQLQMSMYSNDFPEYTFLDEWKLVL